MCFQLRYYAIATYILAISWLSPCYLPTISLAFPSHFLDNPLPFCHFANFCQARVKVGPGQLHVKSKSFNIKVYFKSPRDLDLELKAIIAMPPTTTTTAPKGRHPKKNCRFGENFIIYLTPLPP